MPDQPIGTPAEGIYGGAAANGSTARAKIYEIWHNVRMYFRGLRVAGIPTISVLIGLLMYQFVPQVQDLFLDVFGSWSGAAWHWALFYLMVLAAWVMPIYTSAHWILERYNRLAQSTMSDELVPVEIWVKRSVPAALAAFAMLAVALGQLGGVVSSPSGDAKCDTVCLRQLDERGVPIFANVNKPPAGDLDERLQQSAVEAKPLTTLDRVVLVGAGTALVLAGLGWLSSIYLIFVGGLRATSWIPNTAARITTKIIYWITAIPTASWLSLFVLAIEAIALLGVVVIAWMIYILVFGDPGIVESLDDRIKHLTNLFNYFYDRMGPFFLVLLVLSVIVGPVLLFFINRLNRWCSTCPGWFTRIQLRFHLLTLAVFCLVATAGSVIALWQVFNALMRAKPSDLSLVQIWPLPIISVVLTAGVWFLAKLHTAGRLSLPFTTSLPTLFSIGMVTSVLSLSLVVIGDPLDLASAVSRAPLMPLILGLWVPVFTALTLLSYRAGAPVLVGSLIMLGILALPLGDTHSIRTVKGDAPAERPRLSAAVEQWAKANDCIVPAEGQTTSAKPCPQPVLVLASGGASRAAFKVATVIGDLLDRSNAEQVLSRTPVWSGPSPKPAYRKIFAISSVSGGSLAAVVVQAALADAQLQSPGALKLPPPCRFNLRDTDWYGGVLPSSGPAAASQSWKSCLQLLVAGDFLSPVAVSLVGTDLLNLNPFLPVDSDGSFARLGDRAATLERAWEAHYGKIVGNNTLANRLTTLRAKVQQPSERNWLPILLLNGTSVETGRRIIASDVNFLRPTIPGGCEAVAVVGAKSLILRDCARTFRDAYDLHELFTSTNSLADDTLWNNVVSLLAVPLSVPASMFPELFEPSSCKNCDIRLSTGVTISARFPVISPHGAIENANGAIADRVVDGGYFENNGAITGKELVEDLKARGLDPVVVLITNDPTMPRLPCLQGEVPLGYRSVNGRLMPLVTAPADALMATRESRGQLASIDLCQLVKAEKFVHFGVDPDTNYFGDKQLSMSWWLSKHVQKKIAEGQIERKDAKGDLLPPVKWRSLDEPKYQRVLSFTRR